MGGEISGTIDESIRHAVTKFAHVHFPACEQARDRIVRLGERPEHVHLVGCPRIDLVSEILQDPRRCRTICSGPASAGGSTSTASSCSSRSIRDDRVRLGPRADPRDAEAVEQVGLPAIILWPNADAGSEDIAAGMRGSASIATKPAALLQEPADRRLRAAHGTGDVPRRQLEQRHPGGGVHRHTDREHRHPPDEPSARPNVVDVDYNVAAIADAVDSAAPSWPLRSDAHLR